MITAFPRSLHQGQCHEQLAELIEARGWTRVGVISGDKFESNTGFSQSLIRGCTVHVRRWNRGPTHTRLEVVEELAKEIEHWNPDALVSAGGGSSHDAAKGVATLLALGGRLADHCLNFTPPDKLEVPLLPGDKLPLVAVPSTLSGSEANGAAGFKPHGSSNKKVLASPSLTPTALIIDADLASTTPAKILAGSLMNALDHCVEGLASRRAGTRSRIFLTAALQQIADTIDRLSSKDMSSNTYEQALLASSLAGIGLAGTWLGIAHAIGHVLGARYGVGHGAAHAVVGPAAIRWNASVAGPSHEAIGRTLGLEPTSQALSEWFSEQAGRLALPRTLGELGIPQSDIPVIAQAAWHDHDSYFNPRRAQAPREIEHLLRRVV